MGGFSDTTKRSDADIPFTHDPLTYEDAELLLWRYDTSLSTLNLINTRVMLNCCGDRTVSAMPEKGIIVISAEAKK